MLNIDKPSESLLVALVILAAAGALFLLVGIALVFAILGGAL